MNVNASFVAQVVVFLILAWFMARIVWPPLRKALDDRAARVADALQAAEHGKEELAGASEHARAMMAQAREEKQKLLDDYDRRAHNIIDEARRVAVVEAARIVASARMEADQLLGRANAQLRAQVAEVAVVGAANILLKEIDTSEHARLVAQLKDELR